REARRPRYPLADLLRSSALPRPPSGTRGLPGFPRVPVGFLGLLRVPGLLRAPVDRAPPHRTERYSAQAVRAQSVRPVRAVAVTTSQRARRRAPVRDRSPRPSTGSPRRLSTTVDTVRPPTHHGIARTERSVGSVLREAPRSRGTSWRQQPPTRRPAASRPAHRRAPTTALRSSSAPSTRRWPPTSGSSRATGCPTDTGPR